MKRDEIHENIVASASEFLRARREDSRPISLLDQNEAAINDHLKSVGVDVSDDTTAKAIFVIAEFLVRSNIAGFMKGGYEGAYRNLLAGVSDLAAVSARAIKGHEG